MNHTIKPGVATGKEVQKIHQFAKEKGFALPAINVTGSNTINTVLETAAELNSPVIIQFSNGGAHFNAGKGLSNENQKAAIAGGITSYIEMPNTIPQTTTLLELNNKFKIAERNSHANYSFMFGGTNENIEEIKNIDSKKVAGLKLFLGSSTGNMLVDNKNILEDIFYSTASRFGKPPTTASGLRLVGRHSHT